MTSTKALKAEKRSDTGKGVARKLRAAGRVPAVLYGKDLESMPLSVDAKEAEHLFHSISVENTIVDLKVKGQKGSVQTLVREVQSHPFKADLIHVDFLRVQKGVAVDVEVPIRLEGVPVGVKLHGGSLDQVLHELPVRCIPSKIPELIAVEVSEMDVNDVLRVGDLVVDEDVEVTVGDERTVAHVVIRRAAVEETEEEAALEAEEAEAAEAAAEGADAPAEASAGDAGGDEG